MLVPFVVMPARPWEKDQAELSLDHRQVFITILTIGSKPRKMEFKMLVTDCKQCSHQGLTDTEVSEFIGDLQKMLPDKYQKNVDLDQTRKEQGTWPTQK